MPVIVKIWTNMVVLWDESFWWYISLCLCGERLVKTLRLRNQNSCCFSVPFNVFSLHRGETLKKRNLFSWQLTNKIFLLAFYFRSHSATCTHLPLLHHFLPLMIKWSLSLWRVHSMFVASLEATSGSRTKKTRQSIRFSNENYFRKNKQWRNFIEKSLNITSLVLMTIPRFHR